MPDLTVSGRQVHVLDEGTGPPLLLLHAYPLSSEAFRAQVGGLPARIIAPDHRGFGKSEPTKGRAVAMEAYASDALGVLDALGIDRCVVGGVSMGGYIAMALLHVAPERVAGLVLLDTQPGEDDERTKAGREKTATKVLEEGVEVLIPSMLDRLLAPDSHARDRVADLIRTSATPTGVASALRGMALRPDSSADLRAYRGPSLVVFGEEDQFTGLDKAEELLELLPGAALVRVPRAGHLAHIEAPELVNRALSAFLASAAERGS
jgi:pimeloyl-ACP methyl ester carboxylesterase